MKLWDNIKAPLGDEGLIDVKSLYRRLKVLFNLEITGDGVDISKKGVNGIHLKVTAGSGSGDLPFQVTLSGINFTVSPGLVYSANYDSAANGSPAHVPKLNGVALNATTPPTGITARYIYLECKFSRDGWQMDAPWSILSSNLQPNDDPVVRSYTQGVAKDGTYYLLIAEVIDGVVKQWVHGNIMANLYGADLHAFA